MEKAEATQGVATDLFKALSMLQKDPRHIPIGHRIAQTLFAPNRGFKSSTILRRLLVLGSLHRTDLHSASFLPTSEGFQKAPSMLNKIKRTFDG